MPCPCHAPNMPFFSRPRHSTSVERRPVGYLSAFDFFRLPRGVPRRLDQNHTNLRCRWPVWNQTTFVMDEEKSGSSTLQKNKDGLLNCCTSSSLISGYHADFHEGHGTIGAWQGHGMAFVNGTAWARHARCESAFTVTFTFLTNFKISDFNHEYTSSLRMI